MRLLQRDRKGGFSFTPILHQPPHYAILSHTWGPPLDEVSYQDIIDGTGHNKGTYDKIKFVAAQAEKDKLDYFWVDTCCIDKRNDAELSTAIRSMFQWYKKSTVCYVYLSDVSSKKRNEDGNQVWDDNFRHSLWFKRGWTLQELIAPEQVKFYARGQYLGSRDDLCQPINEITGIDVEALRRRSLETYPFPIRLQWAGKRETTVPEDRAYALMGLCGVVIDPRYGEGEEEAHERLYQKIREDYGRKALDQSHISARNSYSVGKTQESLMENRRTKMEMLKFDTMDSRRKTIKKALKGTCSWILTHPSYQAWREVGAIEQHYGFFWIKGKPGAGKSSLIKYLDTHISNTKDRSDICISFYFNARGERLEKSLVGMYRSLLTQLLLAVPDLRVVLDNARAITGESDATIQELQRLFLDATMRLKLRQLFCFIDALDECREQDVQQMVNDFRDLGQEAFDENISINVCFASRHYPTLDVPTGLQLVLEDVDEHGSDLNEYVQSQQFRVGSSNEAHSIPASVREMILTKANGVFLWVVLVVEILKKEYQNGRIYAVNKRLDQIPKDLSELFQDIVQRDRDNIDEFLLCLKWILYAKRPLALQEFYFAMMAGVDGQSLEWNPEIFDDLMHSFLLSSSKGLAELTKGKLPHVQFIHESVRDFLVTDNGFKHIENNEGASAGRDHEKLKQCCLRGIRDDADACRKEMGLLVEGRNLATTAWKPSTSKALRTQVTDRFPFLDYATTFVLYHSDQAAVDVPQDQFLHNFDLNDWVDKANFLQRHDVNLYKKPLDLVFVCAEHDHANLIMILCGQAHNLKRDTLQRNASPLFAAFANKSKNAARLLLKRDGATDPDEIVQEVIIDNYKGRAAYDRQKTGLHWHWAIKEGYESLALHLLRAVLDSSQESAWASSALLAAVQFQRLKVLEALINRGADVNTHWPDHSSALQVAVSQGSEKVVETLLNRGADVNAHDGEYGSALQAALFHGFKNVAEILLDRGADVKPEGCKHGSALYHASCRGFDNIVDTLLKRGADVNAHEGEHASSLQAAVFCGFGDVARILLDHGADANSRGGKHGSALYEASYQGFDKIAETLLQCGANVNAQEGEHGNALQAAAYMDHETIVELLLDRGADVNAQGGEHGNALQAAACMGHETIVKLLLDRGTDVNAQGGEHGNALQAAACMGHETIVEILLDRGADVNAQGVKYDSVLQAPVLNGRDGQKGAEILLERCANRNAWGWDSNNALYAAASCGNVKLIQILLDRGADINAQGGEHGNALVVALIHGSEEAIRLLLDRGADVNAQGGPFDNALTTASFFGRKKIVEVLLHRGAYVNARGDSFRSALEAASWRRHVEVEKLLLQHGADGRHACR